ncbi:MAG: glycosyltransferase [Pseudodonghicola sp.]
MTQTLSIILPAHNESTWIDGCLGALCGSDPLPEDWGAEIIVVPNGCRDDTAARARNWVDRFAVRGWRLLVEDRAEGGKLGALTHGDAVARQGSARVYLDADVLVSPPLLAQLAEALAVDAPRYAGGRPQVSPSRQVFTCLYARFWARLPFVTTGAPGFGIFAMSAAGRARWGDWPDIISDDTFARLNFTRDERVRVNASYSWPMVEGFANLVRVRRRQNAGVDEVAGKFPALMENADVGRPGAALILRLALRDPLGFLAYAAVTLAVRSPLYHNRSRWDRGR